MIPFVRKYLFKGSERNITAPHILFILLGYVAATTAYYVILFETDYVITRSVLSLCMVVSYILLERSKLSQDTLSYVTPSVIIFWIMLGAAMFGGDFLIFTYTLGCGMISLTYLKPKGILIFTAFVTAVQGAVLFILGRMLMGERFTNEQNYVGFLAMVALNIVLYIFCKKYARASRAKGLFLSSMSHEMRTPLNAIIGMTAIGKDSTDIEKAHYTLNRIESASAHLLGIINDILDMSKIDSGKFELSLKEFNFRHMLEHVADIIAFSAKEKDQKFTVDVSENIPAFLIGDDQRLAQAITNLLGNAVKFTPVQGKITLSANLVGEENNICTLQIDVKDTGIGISKTQQKDLFKHFRQANSSITRNYGGSGLGLAITKGIIEMMNGKIWIESETGKGSTFTFTVQAERGSLSHTPTQAPENNKIPTFENKHILIAEDVEINREIIITLLEPTGIKITCAKDGAEALRIFGETPESFDIILMDIQMPEVDGCEASISIRALDAPNAKTIPIIAMTANVFREDIEYYLSIGMTGHVGKPMDIGEVFGVLKEYLF